MRVSSGWYDGLAVVEDLFRASRVEGCLHPIPKPGPCPGQKRGTSSRVKQLVTPKAKKPKPRSPAKAKGPKATATPGAATHSGYTGPIYEVSAEDQRKLDEYQAAAEALGKLTIFDDGYRAAQRRADDAKGRLPRALVERQEQEQRINQGIDYFRTNRDGEVPDADEFRKEMADELRRAFSDKRIAVRVTPEGLGKVLADGRFKTQHETKAAGPGGGYAPKRRREAEEEMFGIPETGFDAKKRPVYGYVAMNGVDEPAGDFRLEMYGPIQVVLKDEVRTRTTAMVGDSLNDFDKARPSPINSPEAWSFNPRSAVSGQVKRDFANPNFRIADYAEAQIHGGVATSDIDEVVFQGAPSAALRDSLEKAGVRWRSVPQPK
jgi:hypothetical protein